MLPALETVWLEMCVFSLAHVRNAAANPRNGRTLLYLFAVFGIGLVVPSTFVAPPGTNPGMNLVNGSPFIAALRTANIPIVSLSLLLSTPPNILTIAFGTHL